MAPGDTATTGPGVDDRRAEGVERLAPAPAAEGPRVVGVRAEGEAAPPSKDAPPPEGEEGADAEAAPPAEEDPSAFDPVTRLVERRLDTALAATIGTGLPAMAAAA